MDKWNILRGFIAKEHSDTKTKYLEGSQAGDRAKTAATVCGTLELVWKGMDTIDELEKKERENNESDPNNRKSN